MRSASNRADFTSAASATNVVSYSFSISRAIRMLDGNICALATDIFSATARRTLAAGAGLAPHGAAHLCLLDVDRPLL